MKIDQINKKIMEHLRDGRKSFRKISEALGITENTVRARVRKLEESGILSISGYVDAEAMVGHKIAVIGAKLNTMEFERVGEEVSKLNRVVSVGITTGRFDLLITVHLKASFQLLDFIKKEISQIDGIHSIETFVIERGWEIKVPYII